MNARWMLRHKLRCTGLRMQPCLYTEEKNGTRWASWSDLEDLLLSVSLKLISYSFVNLWMFYAFGWSTGTELKSRYCLCCRRQAGVCQAVGSHWGSREAVWQLEWGWPPVCSSVPCCTSDRTVCCSVPSHGPHQEASDVLVLRAVIYTDHGPWSQRIFVLLGSLLGWERAVLKQNGAFSMSIPVPVSLVEKQKMPLQGKEISVFTGHSVHWVYLPK